MSLLTNLGLAELIPFHCIEFINYYRLKVELFIDMVWCQSWNMTNLSMYIVNNW